MAEKEKKMIMASMTVDSELKNKFTEICEELGMSFSGAIQIFMRQVVRDRRLPFTPDLNTRTDILAAKVMEPSEVEMMQRMMTYFMKLQDSEKKQERP